MLLQYFKSIFIPRPSLFDLCLSLFIFIPWIKGDTARSDFLVFYIIFLLALTFMMRPKREYKSFPLSLLTIWAILGLFIHSYDISFKSLTYNWKIYSLMMEGLLYVLFGIIFIRIAVKYSTNLKFVFLLAPFAIKPFLTGWFYFGKSTYIMAFGLSVIIYLFLTRKFKLVIPTSLLGIGIIIHKWAWLSMKFRCRPYVWYQLFLNMFYHPQRRDALNILDPGIQFSPFVEKYISQHQWILQIKPWLQSIFGSGFSQYLNKDYTWVDTTIWNKLLNNTNYTFGWVHNQNDYLNFGQCLGPIGLGLLIWFIVQSLKEIGIRPMLILFMTILLICFGQLTMFDPGRGGVCLILSAVCIAVAKTEREA